ncbi:hypothetical protein ACFL4B_04290 [Candidatus Neomarinimicrobiota bacterium]
MKEALLLVISIILSFNTIQAQDIVNKLGGNTASETYDVTDSNDNILLRVQGNGKVGIGTVSPDSLLDVAGTIKTTGFMMPTGAEDGAVLTSDADGNTSWEVQLESIELEEKLWDSTGVDVFNLNTGNVGIGTTSPDEKLHVVGNIKIVDGNQAVGKVLTSDGAGIASWQTNTSYDVPLTFNWSLSTNGGLLSNDDWVGVATLFGNSQTYHVYTANSVNPVSVDAILVIRKNNTSTFNIDEILPANFNNTTGFTNPMNITLISVEGSAGSSVTQASNTTITIVGDIINDEIVKIKFTVTPTVTSSIWYWRRTSGSPVSGLFLSSIKITH